MMLLVCTSLCKTPPGLNCKACKSIINSACHGCCRIPPCAYADLAGQDLYQDLLTKANGSHEVASRWLTEMGVEPPYRRSPPGTDHAAYSRRCRVGHSCLLERQWRAEELHPAAADSKDLDTAAELAGAPSNFFCPISMHLFRDPVVLPTGQT